MNKIQHITKQSLDISAGSAMGHHWRSAQENSNILFSSFGLKKMVFCTNADNKADDSTVMEKYELSNKNTAMMIKDQSTLKNMVCIYS